MATSSVHSIMMEKLAQPGEGEGARPPPFTISTITDKVVVYVQGADDKLGQTLWKRSKQYKK